MELRAVDAPQKDAGDRQDPMTGFFQDLSPAQRQWRFTASAAGQGRMIITKTPAFTAKTTPFLSRNAVAPCNTPHIALLYTQL